MMIIIIRVNYSQALTNNPQIIKYPTQINNPLY